MQKFIVEDGEEGVRLDVFLTDKLPDYSRAYLKKMIAEDVLVNEKQVKAGFKVRLADKVTIEIEKERSNTPKEIDIPIIYEDDDCLVINKPIGVLSHSKGNFNDEATVETFIMNKVSGFSGGRAGIVHRLDRATSGVMICAKNPESLKWLQKQFSTRKVKKTYIAIINGHLPNDEAIIDMPIGRNPKAPATFRVSSNGKNAITGYKVIKSSSNYSLLSLEPKTGRTHQLRVHLSHLGHPIVGDIFYKGKPADRLFLHAYSLEIKLLDNEMHKFEVKMPLEFSKMINEDNG
jgi:23S rRNA pseudouridine1911/1915/1917 synthase